MITLTLINVILIVVLIKFYRKRLVEIENQKHTINQLSLQYVKANRDAQNYKKKYSDTLYSYSRDIGFKKWAVLSMKVTI